MVQECSTSELGWEASFIISETSQNWFAYPSVQALEPGMFQPSENQIMVFTK
jgi:hypothetical protein